MKSIYKLTPWVLLAAIIIVLVISFFMNKSSGHIEGMTGQSISEYSNPVYKLHDNIYFDEINGNLVIDYNTYVTVMNRMGTVTNGINKSSMEPEDNMYSPTTVMKFTHDIVDENDIPKYTIFYSAIKKHTNIYIFEYNTDTIIVGSSDTNTKSIEISRKYSYVYPKSFAGSENDPIPTEEAQAEFETILQTDKSTSTLTVKRKDNENDGWTRNLALKGTIGISLRGSYAFTKDHSNCVPQGEDTGTCDIADDNYKYGVGYYDNTSSSYKACDCTFEFNGEKKEEFPRSGRTPIRLVNADKKYKNASGLVTVKAFNKDLSLEKVATKDGIGNIFWEPKLGNVIVENIKTMPVEYRSEHFGVSDNYKFDEAVTGPGQSRNITTLTKSDTLSTRIHRLIGEDIIIASHFSNNVNIIVLQYVQQTNSYPTLELITSKHHIIETPNTTSSTTNAMASSNSTSNSTSNSSSSNSSSSNPAQDMGDSIYNRVSSKIGDVIEHELDKLLNPDASTDDRYILKTQVVPPVCPTCPNCVSNCNDGGVCSDCGGNGGSGTKTESGKSLADENKESSKNPVSNVIGETGDVAEQTVGAAGDLVTTTATATGDLVKTTAGTVVDVADSTVGGVARDLYSGTKGVAGDVYGATTGVAGDVYGTATGVVGDLYGGAKSLTTDLYGGIKNLGPDSQRRSNQLPSQIPSGVTNTGSNIGVTQRTAYSNTGNQPSNIYNYYGALPNKETRYVPITTDFSAFGR